MVEIVEIGSGNEQSGVDDHTPERSAVLSIVASTVLGTNLRSLVAIDGRSGARKSTFADELARTIAVSGVCVVRSTIDSFHRPRLDLARLGPAPPKGYYCESHQLETLITELLEPFSSGHSHVLVAAFDEPSNTPTREHVEVPDCFCLGPRRTADEGALTNLAQKVWTAAELVRLSPAEQETIPAVNIASLYLAGNGVTDVALKLV